MLELLSGRNLRSGLYIRPDILWSETTFAEDLEIPQSRSAELAIFGRV